eukprot:3863599-Pleurochrysis_carterae.AAC.1
MLIPTLRSACSPPRTGPANRGERLGIGGRQVGTCLSRERWETPEMLAAEAQKAFLQRQELNELI